MKSRSFTFILLPLVASSIAQAQVAGETEEAKNQQRFNQDVSSYKAVDIKNIDLSQCSCMKQSFESKAQPKFYDAGPVVKTLVKEIVAEAGLESNFTLLASFDMGYNAFAAINQNQRLLIYNPKLLADLEKQTGSKWAAVSVLAHEIGHHLQGHTITPGGSTPFTELQADRFMGHVMGQMKASLIDSQSAIKIISDEAGGHTHPPQADRLKAIQEGWERSTGKTKAQITAASLVNTSQKTSATQWEWEIKLDADLFTLKAVKSVTWHLHPTMDDSVRSSTDKASGFSTSDVTGGAFKVKAIVEYEDGRKETLRKMLTLK